MEMLGKNPAVASAGALSGNAGTSAPSRPAVNPMAPELFAKLPMGVVSPRCAQLACNLAQQCARKPLAAASSCVRKAA